MRAAVVLVVALAGLGCTDHEQPLANMTDAQVSVMAFAETEWNEPNVIVDVWSESCRPFDHRLQAYVGDTQLAFDDFWGAPGDGCVSAQARGPLQPTQAPLALTIADPSEVWTVTFPGPYRSDIEIGPLTAGREATIAWPYALPIVNACIRIEVGEPLPLFHGCSADYDDAVRVDAATNTVHFDVPMRSVASAQVWVELVTQAELDGSSGDKSLPRCDGPARCDITVYGDKRVNLPIAP